MPGLGCRNAGIMVEGLMTEGKSLPKITSMESNFFLPPSGVPGRFTEFLPGKLPVIEPLQVRNIYFNTLTIL